MKIRGLVYLYALIATLILTLPVPSLAVTVNSSIGTYEVTTLPAASYTSQIGVLDDQPWWADDVLALEFATLVGTDLGLPNIFDWGPYFAYGDNTST